MSKETKPDEVSLKLPVFTGIIFVCFFFGYMSGKNLAEKHNAQDARAAMQAETLAR